MDLKTVSIVAVVLIAFHLATIIVIRIMSGNTFSKTKDIGTAMGRLKRDRPVAHAIYVASLVLPLVEFLVVAIIKLGG